MSELIKKIEAYNIFNFLMPGVIGVSVIQKFTAYNFTQNNLLVDFFIFYFCGLTISRIGSIILEPIMQRIKWVKFAEYENFLKASKNDDKLALLSQENNTYRTIIALVIVISAAIIYNQLSLGNKFLREYTVYLGLTVLLIIFSVAYRKQTKYINRRIDHAIKK